MTAQIDVLNPATGEIAGRVPDMTAEVPQLVARARVAQEARAARTVTERAKVLARMRRWLVDNRATVVESTMAETGKTYEDAVANEVFAVADAFRFWERNAARYLREETFTGWTPFTLGRRFTVQRRPIGVVGVIAPWNYPLTLGLGDAIPALMAGNAVVIKPSEVTPLTTRLVIEGFAEAGMPTDLLQVATGGGDTGAALVEHADMIMFTGSTRTGRKVGARCGERLIPCSLELGGKDPMIVCADANLDRAANAAATYGLLNSGQICMSIERIYVEESVHDAFVDKFVTAVGKTRQATGDRPGDADVGAMTFPPQLDTVERHVADAITNGATVHIGGRRGDAKGQYYEPTVLTGVTHDMACMREETFGPTLPVMKARDADDAVRLANDSGYGLAASVYTRDPAKGRAIAARLNAGSCAINDSLIQFAHGRAPFGGVGESGVGARHGRDGILKYTHPHTTLVTRFGLSKDLGWFPGSRHLTTVMESVLARYYRR